MVEHIKANAAMTVQQLRPISRMNFGYDLKSVEWLEGYIERLRQSGEFKTGAAKDKLTSVLGAFLGECIVRCYGGAWMLRDEGWCVVFDGENIAFPFAKVSKQLDNGLEDGIASFFGAIPVLLAGQVDLLPQLRKPWWKFW